MTVFMSTVWLCSACAAQRERVPLTFEPTTAAELSRLVSVRRDKPSVHDPVPADGVITIESGRGGPLTEEPGPPTATLPEIADPFLPAPPQTLGLAWPLPATGVTSPFGPRSDPINGAERFHYGVDLQGTYGQTVESVAPGIVLFAGWNYGHGRQVVVQHDGGWQSSYSHLSQFIVHRGQRVRRGQPLGQMGNSGRSTGPHLHLEITRWGSYYDPLDLLGTSVPID